MNFHGVSVLSFVDCRKWNGSIVCLSGDIELNSVGEEISLPFGKFMHLHTKHGFSTGMTQLILIIIIESANLSFLTLYCLQYSDCLGESTSELSL